MVPDTPSLGVTCHGWPSHCELPPLSFQARMSSYQHLPQVWFIRPSLKTEGELDYEGKKRWDLERRHNTDMSPKHVSEGEYLWLSIWDKAWFLDHPQQGLRKVYAICILNHHQKIFSMCKMYFLTKKTSREWIMIEHNPLSIIYDRSNTLLPLVIK